jgi:hypothetical protein
MQKRIRISRDDRRKVAVILTELDMLDLNDLSTAICQAMEVEQGHDREAAYAIASKAIRQPELFLL